MQSIDTHDADSDQPTGDRAALTVGRVEDLPEGSVKTVELSRGRELALYRVDGEFYATENFCPHKGAPLAEGRLCDHVIECDWHGWQFDVRSGRCLTVSESIRTFKVFIEDDLVKIEVESAALREESTAEDLLAERSNSDEPAA